MTRSTVIHMLALALTAGLAAAPREASANGGTHDCYNPSDDKDGDAYANKNAQAFPVGAANDLHCNWLYVEKAGDCDDQNAAVHPRALEVDNGIDDNCDGKIDEPVPYFYDTGYQVTSSSFSVLALLNDSFMESWQAQDLPLGAEVEITDLHNSKFPILRTLPVTNHYDRWAVVNIDGLSPARVYKVRVRFGACFFSCSYTPWSQDFYGVTDGTNKKSKVRASMVHRALRHMRDSDNEVVGYNGDWTDGTAYGASPGEMWCSEFYSSMGHPYLDWNGDRPDSTDDMLWAFADSNGNYDPYWVSAYAEPGDYLALDTNDDGKKNHSAMVLAWDVYLGKAWTVEGNSGNEVKVNKRMGSDIFGFGHITDSMLK